HRSRPTPPATHRVSRRDGAHAVEVVAALGDGVVSLDRAVPQRTCAPLSIGWGKTGVGARWCGLGCCGGCKRPLAGASAPGMVPTQPTGTYLRRARERPLAAAAAPFTTTTTSARDTATSERIVDRQPELVGVGELLVGA